MRRNLMIGLASTSLASAAALFWPQAPAPDIVATVDPRATAAVAAPGTTPSGFEPAFRGTLPRTWPVIDVPPLAHDPFAESGAADAAAAQASAAPAAAVAVAAVPPPPAPLAPHAPPLGARFVGRMTGPDGRHWVYVSAGGAAVPVSQGTELPQGFVVSAMSDAAIDFVYPPTGEHVSLPLPARPPEETSR